MAGISELVLVLLAYYCSIENITNIDKLKEDSLFMAISVV
jgi:ABC-type arginine transport system permease subunit